MRYVVDLDTVGEVSNAGSAGILGCAICVSDDNHSVAAVNEFLPMIVSSTLCSSHAKRVDSNEDLRDVSEVKGTGSPHGDGMGSMKENKWAERTVAN